MALRKKNRKIMKESFQKNDYYTEHYRNHLIRTDRIIQEIEDGNVSAEKIIDEIQGKNVDIDWQMLESLYDYPENAEGVIYIDDLICDCHPVDCFIEIYRNSFNNFLGTVSPNGLDDYLDCVFALIQGENPIEAGWEDGIGNSLSYKGWGEEEE